MQNLLTERGVIMKGKKFLAALLVASMLCPNSIIYASEASETEVETEVSEEVPVISEDNGIETSVSISTDKIDIEIDEESYFYVDGIPSDEEITVTVENEAIAAVTAVTADMVEDTVKQNTPDTALWYSVKGIEVGETFITILVGEEEKEIAVHVTAIEEDINEDNEAEQEEQPLEGEEPEDEGQTENELAPEYIEDQQLQQMMEGQDAVVFSEEGYEVGWKEEADGTRYYINDAGQFYTGIAEIDGVLYYFDETTGYLCTTGQWINKDGKKYFCNEKGVLYRDQFIKFDTTYYYMGNDGSVQTGVFSTGDTLRYADEKTGIVQMTSGWINFDGKKFFANEEGILYQRQFIKFGDIHYYMGTDGSVQLGTFRVGGVWYHSNSSTGELKLELGWIEDNGKKYYAGEGGVIFVNQFIKFGTTYMTMNNTFYKAVNNEIENVVNNHGDVLYTRDPALDPKKQNEQIKDLVSLGIDVLIINPVESSSINKTLKEVKKAGIKIIVVDAPISDDQIADCTVVSDNYDAGVQCAKDMMQRFDHARIALLEHSKALSAVDRINGFKDTVALNENYQIVGSEDCLGQTELALPALNKIIQQGIDFDVVFCLNDPTALGALASIKENDLGHDVFIYGVDGSPNIKKLVAETKAIVGTSSQSPTSLGKETIKVAYKMLHHKKYKRSIIVPTKLITKENIEEYDITGWQ